MNGAISAWKDAGYEVETDINEPVPAEEFGVTVPAHPEYWISIDEVKEKLKTDDNFKLVSIRSEAEWLGETSGYTYIDRAGEPEGAVWGHAGSDPYHMEDYLNDDGGWYQWQMDDSNPVQVGDPVSEECQHTTVGELPTDKAAK